MRSGLLRHMIKVQTLATALDSAGQETKTASTLVRKWPAEVLDKAGGEQFRGRQVTATATHVVRTRYNSDFAPEQQIVDHLGRTLQILAIVDRGGRQMEIELDCKRLA